MRLRLASGSVVWPALRAGVDVLNGWAELESSIDFQLFKTSSRRDQRTATKSISMRAPRGSAATCTVERAGGTPPDGK